MSITILKLATKSNGPLVPQSPQSEIYNIAEKHLSSVGDHFRLSRDFLAQYADKKPNFGFNGLGEFVFYRTYSRLKPDGSKETFTDVLERVIEGCYEIQRRWCNSMHIPWDYDKAQGSAQEMFQLMWDFKFLPPGRGLWMMGTKFMWERGSAALNNCGFVSTSDLSESDPAEPFCFLMDMSMLGVGVGFDTKGAGKIHIYQPNPNIVRTFIVPDSREGWVDSVRHLIRSYTVACKEGVIEFDYSQIRLANSDIKGFGGKASGPDILIELHVLIRSHLDAKAGQSLDSVDITDIMNYIGRCVVAGNVRRCLPKGTLIHLKRGLVPIEQVQVGDLVLTADGYHPVAENVAQGVQRVVTINSQMGPFRCTDRHRIAVMTGVGTYEWKRAFQLESGDRMVFVDAVVPGTSTVLPGYSDVSRRSTAMAVPGLTTDVAWFLGMLYGDGYVYPGRPYKGRKHHGASVAIPVNRDEYHDEITVKIEAGFAAFGFADPGEQPSKDNCRKIRVISKQLAHYLYKNFKQANKPIDVPECIRLGLPEVRAAYLAGLLDSDGSTKNRPVTLISSVYRDFLRQVQALYSSLGIPTKLRLRKEADEAGQAKWEISLVGDYAISAFDRFVQPHAVKGLRAMSHANGHDFGYPSEWIGRSDIKYGHSWTPQQDQMTYNRAVLCGAATANLIPVEVKSVVDEGVAVETYDLTVPDRSEFVAEGRLVHNTAEIAFGDADDEPYCSMKNATKTLLQEDLNSWFEVTNKLYSEKKNKAEKGDFVGKNIPDERLLPAINTWNALNHHRWASNNSIFARIGMDYRPVGQQISVNGEPGLLWLSNIRDYGRMIDGLKPGVDGRVMGSNPCLSGDNKLLTEAGYQTIYDLWLAGGMQEYSGLGDKPLEKYGSQTLVNRNGLVQATNVYRTGVNVEMWRVTFDDGSSIDATANHNFIVLDRFNKRVNGKKRVHYAERRATLSELSVGQMVPLNQTVHFGKFHDPAYAELAGWCIGDGSLSPMQDGQVRANCTCYDSDAVDVLPKLRGLMLELYTAHNRSSHQSPVYAGWNREQEHFDHDEVRIGSNVLGRLLRNDGVVSGDKHRVPASVWNGTRETVAGFIRGLASADGFALLSDNGTISVRITQSNQPFLNECRLLLNQFGIASTVQFRRKAGTQMMNDGKGGKRLYNRKAGYELIISGMKQVRKFLDCIGFIQNWKAEEAIAWLQQHHGSNNSDTGRYVKIRSIEQIDRADTYCLTEPGDNQIVVNGCQIGQCVEQSLESYELCNLVETFPSNHENADDYMRTLKFAYLYAKTVTLLPTHNRRTNSVTMRNRRIGLSQSGIVEAFAKFGRRAVLRDFCDAGYNEVRRWDQIYSEWMCVPRSIKVTSVKPSGTVSLVVGVSPGIHHPEAGTYWRLVRVAKDSVLVKILKKAGFKIEPVLADPDRTVVVYFGVKGESGVRPVGEVTIWEQMQNAIDYQRYWADNQVSCTVKFKLHEAQDIARVLEAYEDQLKGISFLPQEDHGYAQAPYTPCAADEVVAYNEKLGVTDYSEYLNEALGSVYCDNDKCVMPGA